VARISKFGLVFLTTLALGAATGVTLAESIKLPPGTKVKIVGHSGTVALDNGVSGSFDCSCSQGNGPAPGTCSLIKSGNVMSCVKGATDTCNDSCGFGTVTKGITAAISARMRAAGGGAAIAPAAH
jgi:hypothetical protein